MPRLLKVDALPTTENLERIIESGPGHKVSAVRKMLAQMSLKALTVLLVEGRRSGYLIAHRSRHLACRGRQVDGSAIERRRGALVAQCGELISLHNQREHVSRFQAQRFIDRSERRGMVMNPCTGAREREVGGNIGAPRCDEAFEELSRLQLRAH